MCTPYGYVTPIRTTIRYNRILVSVRPSQVIAKRSNGRASIVEEVNAFRYQEETNAEERRGRRGRVATRTQTRVIQSISIEVIIQYIIRRNRTTALSLQRHEKGLPLALPM